MSISASLANALTGLTAASRAAQLVSSNVANAMTEGYARRELDLSAQVTGGTGAGVQIDGVRRIVDETILRDRRLADAALGSAQAEADFYRSTLSLLGEPGDPASLGSRLSSFETALIEASSRPDATPRLAAVLSAAQSLTTGLNDASDGLQTLRQDADAAIEQSVKRLNFLLGEVAEANKLIQRNKASGQDFPALLDHRQSLVDDVSVIVPVRQINRENDTIALYSMAGALLIDIEPASFDFVRTDPITADMTIASGALSGIMLNGRQIDMANDSAPMSGGALASQFAVRDELATSFQQSLDGLAAEVISRFQNPALDGTRAIGDPGLFTDRGVVLDPLDVTGIAGRISINSAADPATGGALWRLRDGLGALTQGPPGDSSLLIALSDTLNDGAIPIFGDFGGASRDIPSLATDLVSNVGHALVTSERQLGFDKARYDVLREAEASDGVDTDQEMQKLLLIEQSYAANAKVVQTVDRLIQSLLEI